MKTIKILAQFAGHVVAATFIFLVIATGAVALHMVRTWMVAHGVDAFITHGMHMLEILIFGCDILSTVVWIGMSTYAAIKAIIKAEKEEE